MRLGPAVAIGAGLALAALVYFGSDTPDGVSPTGDRCDAGMTLVCDAVDTAAIGKGHGRYRRVEIQSQECVTATPTEDGGVELSAVETRAPSPKASLQILRDSCRPATEETADRILDGGVNFIPLACGCRKASGVCEYQSDAGTVAAPLGRTLGPGYPPFEVFSGEGCERKPCVETFGEPSWPSTCPGG